MIKTTLKKKLMHDLDKLPVEMQVKVQDFILTMLVLKKKGVPGRSLLKYSGVLDADACRKITSAVREGCGIVDSHEW
jgi:hypothetical protein